MRKIFGTVLSSRAETDWCLSAIRAKMGTPRKGLSVERRRKRKGFIEPGVPCPGSGALQ